MDGKSVKKVDQIEYMTTAGDHTSAYASSIKDAWGEYKGSCGTRRPVYFQRSYQNDMLFVLGNHERWSTAGAAIETVRAIRMNIRSFREIVERMYETGEDPVETSNYIIVPFGTEAPLKTPLERC